MADFVWPDELPGTLRLEGLSDTLGDNTFRSAVDAGPEKTRARSTAAPDTVSGTMIVSTAQSAFRHLLQAEPPREGPLSSGGGIRALARKGISVQKLPEL
jgi:hypothetical protein